MGSLLELDVAYGTSSNNGNVLSQTIHRSGTSWQQTYSYDGLNRLSGASETVGGTASWTRDFGYDSRGNRWVTTNTNLPSLTNETPAASTWFGGDNRLSSWAYDSVGNVTAIANMTRSFTYDGENRQVTADVGGVATSYFYDGEGRRVKKVTPSNTTIFVYDASGNLAAEYGGPASSTGGTRYYTQDHLGSTRMITDSTGAVQTCLDDLPFGQELGNHTATGRTDACFGDDQYPNGTPSDDPIKFTSKERDSETGLDYFGARYMSSAQGRFTSADKPLIDQHAENPQSWNLYAYVRNNPLASVDVDGHRSCKGDAGACRDILENIKRSEGVVTSSSSGRTTTITHGDGTIEIRTGNIAFRDHNPGNLRPYAFTDRYDRIGTDVSNVSGEFAVFENSRNGERALRGLLSTSTVQDRTLLEEMQIYAPATDNNDPAAYADELGKAIGVSVDTRVGDLTTEQFDRLVERIKGIEGYYDRNGRVVMKYPEEEVQ